MRALEIQSHRLLEKKNKLGDTSKEYLPQHMLQNLLETEHPDRRHVPGGIGTACLGGQSSGSETWEG